MPAPRGLDHAYRAEELAYSTLCEFRAAIAPNGQPRKLSREDADTLANLVNAWVACQERIRLHRRVPLPGTARPKATRNTAGKRARSIEQARAVPLSSITPANVSDKAKVVDSPPASKTSGLSEYPG